MNDSTTVNSIQYAVVGEESQENLRLFDILKSSFGKPNVQRILELRHLREYLSEIHSHPVVLCLDLFAYDLMAVTEVVGGIRDDFPKVVFTLYIDKDEYAKCSPELPGDWAARFGHYYKVYRESDDVEYEPIVRASLRGAQSEAVYNMGGKPIRLTPSAKKGLIGAEPEEPDLSHTVFLSYSRKDWDGFVRDLVNDLAQGTHKVWLDQDYILGGDDWMDAVGAALQECDTLLLVLSPESINSKYVKMEYRYFFKQEKPIVPILYQEVKNIPFELATLHYLDFTGNWRTESMTRLRNILARRHKGNEV
jgi:hypothetical protein